MAGLTNPYALIDAYRGMQAQRAGERQRKDALGANVGNAIQGFAQYQLAEQRRAEEKAAQEARDAEEKRRYDEQMDFRRKAAEEARRRYNVEQGQGLMRASGERKMANEAASEQQRAAEFAMRATTPVQGPPQKVGILGGEINVPGSMRLPTMDSLLNTPNPAGMMGLPGAGPATMRTPIPRGITPDRMLDIGRERRSIEESLRPAPTPMPRNPELDEFARKYGLPSGLDPQDMARLGGMIPKPEKPEAPPTRNPALEEFAGEAGVPYWPGATPADLERLGRLRPRQGPSASERRAVAESQSRRASSRLNIIRRTILEESLADADRAQLEAERSGLERQLAEATAILRELGGMPDLPETPDPEEIEAARAQGYEWNGYEYVRAGAPE